MELKQRDFILGDEWFYFKIYTGVKTADTLLTEIIEPLSNELLKKKLIEKWFFIRYSDPDFHLRIRFKIIDKLKLSEIVIALNGMLRPYIDNRMISKFQSDSYTRELERYGNKTIEDAESLFFYDSQMTLQMLQLIEGDEGETYRWHFACMAVDSLLNDFGFSEKEKLEITDKLQQGYGQEFGMDTKLKVQLDDKFRKERQQIRSFLFEGNDFYKPFCEIVSQKSLDTKNIIDKIKTLHAKNALEIDLDSMISSFIHMMLNRIFKSKQRLNEMVIYSLLYRYYKSEIARKLKVS